MVDLDMKKLKDASMVLRALKNTLRQRIFRLIKEYPGITVMELYVKLHIEQSVASMHLGILRQSGIVRTERNGRTVHYHLHEANIRIIALLVEQLAGLHAPGMSSSDSEGEARMN